MDVLNRRVARRLAIALVAAVAIAPISTSAQLKPDYQPIPPGFDFPAAEAALLKLRDTEDVAAMRKHAWSVFAGITKPAPGGEAIWETWYSSQETFASGPQIQAAPGAGPSRPFRKPRQFSTPGQPQLEAAGVSLLSFVMFNKEAHDHIRMNALHTAAKLDSINNAFTAQTPVEQRAIKPFDPKAVSLKLIWQVVHAQGGMTPLNVWDQTPTNPDAMGNPEGSWKRWVLVDPTRANIPANETADFRLGTPQAQKAHVVALNRFYSFKITSKEIDAVRSVDPTAQVGDYAVFIGMHMTTKEIPDWVWATFWWHDRPDNGVFAADRPASVKGVWRNYLMDVSYSMDTPREYDGTPNSVFNPYLEARFPNGMGSNCMTCHQKSVWPVPEEGFLPVTRGPRKPDDPLFKSSTKLDFLWSLGFEAQ